jgi:hypothetical protein
VPCTHHPRRGRGSGRPGLGAQHLLDVIAVLVAVTLGAGAAAAQLPTADKQTLAELALRWAVDGGIPDVKLLQDPSKLVVIDQNLPPRVALRVPNRTVEVQSPLQIQVRADMEADFLYFRLGPFTGDKDHASVPIALVWAVGVRSKTPYLSGGGATLQFERRDGQWTLLPVSERWMS